MTKTETLRNAPERFADGKESVTMVTSTVQFKWSFHFSSRKIVHKIQQPSLFYFFLFSVFFLIRLSIVLRDLQLISLDLMKSPSKQTLNLDNR